MMPGSFGPSVPPHGPHVVTPSAPPASAAGTAPGSPRATPHAWLPALPAQPSPPSVEVQRDGRRRRRGRREDGRRPLRVAMLGLRGLPATYGGIERHVEEIASRLAERGHDVTVYCRPGYTPEQIQHYRGVRLVHANAVVTKHLEAFTHTGLAAASAIGEGYDVVHYHGLGPGLFTPLSRFASRAKVVQTIHGLDNQRVKWSGPAQYVLGVGGWLSGRIPDATIGVSRALVDHYAERHGRVAAYIPNGAPVVDRREPEHITRRFGLRGKDYVLWVGRLVPEKAPHLLVRAFRQLDTDVRLVVVGGSSHSDDYTEQLRREAGGDPRVILPGYVYGEQLAELFSNAALYVQPSLLEGLPLTLLEAAAYGLPVVVSDIAPHLEVIGTDGPGQRVVPSGDVDALRDAIAGSLSAAAEVAAGAAGLHERVRSHYDWEAVTDRTVEIYRRVLGARV